MQYTGRHFCGEIPQDGQAAARGGGGGNRNFILIAEGITRSNKTPLAFFKRKATFISNKSSPGAGEKVLAFI